MTPEEKQEFKDYIHNSISGYVARVESQNAVMTEKLTTISDTLTRQNGRLSKAEEAINMALQERGANRLKQDLYFTRIDGLENRLAVVEGKEMTHVTTCPNVPLIRQLQDEALSNKSVKRFMFLMFTSGISIGALVVAIIKIWA